MAAVEDQVKSINEQRMKLWERSKEILDKALAEGRSLSQEEINNNNTLNADITRLDATRDALVTSEGARVESETINDEYRRATTTTLERDGEWTDEKRIESMFRKQLRSKGVDQMDIDLRGPARIYESFRMGARGADLAREFRLIAGDTGASGGSLTVPTTVANTIYAYMTASVALRRMNSTIITTASGNPLNFPRVGTHGIATQVASTATAFSGTDPVLTQMQLSAYDAGQLVAISNDLLQDTGVDLLSFVGRNVGRAIGQLTAQWYVTGTGTSQPKGVMTAVGGAGTVATGGSLILGPAGANLEKLIDVQYSVADSYRINGAEWLMRDLTGATVRKIRDGAGGTVGQFVWQPSPTVGLIGGQPDTFLGDPVYFDPNVASMASDAKIIAYGDFSAFYIRDVAGFRLERSDDLYFDKNQVAFRGILRTDSNLIDSNAINALHQAVT